SSNPRRARGWRYSAVDSCRSRPGAGGAGEGASGGGADAIEVIGSWRCAWPKPTTPGSHLPGVDGASGSGRSTARHLGPDPGPGVEVGADVAATVEAGLRRGVPVVDIREVRLVLGMEGVAVSGRLLLR